MELTRVIRRPIITEKTNEQLSQNVYTFEVDWAANKFQIKEAVEFIFNVKVLRVNTSKIDKKPKRLGRFAGFKNRYKKAVVLLAEGNTINYYPQEEANAKKEAAKAEAKAAKKEAAKKEVSEKESAVAEKIAAKKAAKKENK